MNKRLFVAMGLLIVMSMLLAACGGAVAPTAVAPSGPAATAAPAPEEITNPLIGSGQLDGNGIPVDFFNDIHVRKAFNYCFDWGTYINDVYKGEAVQTHSVIVPGMLGYNADSPVYTYDPAKCEEEMKLAWDGKVWENGFRVQVAYNTGNTTRQVVGQIIQAGLASVNDKFVIDVIGLPWPAFLQAQRDKKLPVFISGWQEDIHDPHNWVVPYLTGTYGRRQSMPDDMTAIYADLIEKGITAKTDAERQKEYYAVADQYYKDPPGILLAVGTGRHYFQPWVSGFYYNPIYPGTNGDWYALAKSAEAKDPSTFLYVTFGSPETFDPALDYETSGAELIQATMETLVFYDREKATQFKPQLAESWTVSDDGKTYTFKVRSGIKFHEGGDMTPSDVAYSFQRGLLQGGTSSPQWLLTEPFYGTGIDDISLLVDPEGNLYDDREGLKAADPAKLKAACEQTMAAIVADDAAGTVTMTLSQPWAPFLATIAQTWGSVMDKEWVVAKGGWDGSCDTWQNFYAMTSEEDPFTKLLNGTGPYRLASYSPSEEAVLEANPDYWRTAEIGPLYDNGPTGVARLGKVVYQYVDEWGTRFAMLQAGDADSIEVPIENRPQIDEMVGTICHFDLATNDFKQPCDTVDGAKGKVILFRDYPLMTKTDVFFNFKIAN